MNRAYLEGRYSYFYNRGCLDTDACGYFPGEANYDEYVRGYFDQLHEATPLALAA